MSNTQNIFYKPTYNSIMQNIDTITMFNQRKGKDTSYFKESTPVPIPNKSIVHKDSLIPEQYLP